MWNTPTWHWKKLFTVILFCSVVQIELLMGWKNTLSNWSTCNTLNIHCSHVEAQSKWKLWATFIFSRFVRVWLSLISENPHLSHFGAHEVQHIAPMVKHFEYAWRNFQPFLPYFISFAEPYNPKITKTKTEEEPLNIYRDISGWKVKLSPKMLQRIIKFTPVIIAWEFTRNSFMTNLHVLCPFWMPFLLVILVFSKIW